MKLRILFLIQTMIIVSITAHCQSIYSFQYNFHNSGDTVNYYALLIRYVDGSGLLRIRFETGAGSEDAVVETNTDEQYAVDRSGLEDTNTMIIRFVNPIFIFGDSKIRYTVPVFVFKYNASTDFFEPATVSGSETNIEISANNSFSWQLIEGAGLKKDFVLQFFSEDDDLYKNFFKPVTRGLSATEKNIRMHLLIVADTLDEEIGSSCAKDMVRAIETFKTLTDYLGIKYLTKTICGRSYSKANVQAAIKALRPGANDIVIFYYTGHGFRLPEEPRAFPNLKLKNFRNLRKNFRDSISWIKKDRQDNITYSLNIEDIFTQIRKKGARFNLVMSDCCNNDIFSVNAKGTKPGKTKGSGVEWNEDNIRKLFLNTTPMSILATAAQVGQKATSNNNFGGFFSYFFKMSMENYCSKLKTSATWDLIFQDAKAQTINKANHTYCDKPYTPENICRQSPTYKIVSGR